MSTDDDSRSGADPLHDGPYTLRTLLDDVPLSADGASEGIKINCVEYFGQNLYIGTSASELLHFVQIPPDPSDRTSRPTFILASRLRPSFAESANSQPGIQQILLLPQVSKACVLCNWTVTFYSLPELSPVFGTTQVKNCNWVGGVDLNGAKEDLAADNPPQYVTVLLSLNRKIQLVRIGDDVKGGKKIDVGESTVSIRRDSIACVADSRSYALLDVDRQLKIPLMTISSLDNSQPAGQLGQAQDVAGSSEGGLSRSASAAQNRPYLTAESHGHSRSTSLGGLVSSQPQDHQSPRNSPSPAQSISPRPRPESPAPRRSEDSNKPLPDVPGSTKGSSPPPQAASTKPQPVFLKPHIVSPTPDEFMLVTGTGPVEPGIGIFVNLDGDPTRPTIEFERYPRDVVIDGGSVDMSSSYPSLGEAEEGYVLATMTKTFDDELRHGLEIQRWDDDGTNQVPPKAWLDVDQFAGGDQTSTSLGIRSLVDQGELTLHEIIDRLSQRRFSPFLLGNRDNSAMSLKSTDSRTASSLERVSKERELFERDADTQSEDSLPDNWERNRNAEEEGYAARFAKSHSRLAVWSGKRIWWAVRNPLLLRLEARLDAACGQEGKFLVSQINRRHIYSILNSIRGQDARSELEFVTFSYIRQKAGVLLLGNLLDPGNLPFSESEVKALEEVLLESTLDARVVISLIPGLRNEVVETRKGIWIYGGVKESVEHCLRDGAPQGTKESISKLDGKVVQFLRRFLGAWRKKKGFGSVPDDNEVFRTVDAALLTILLELDQNSPKGLARSSSSPRVELYEVVDKGVDCFDRAVTLLESYHRLFVLSRLYQSRKMAGDVLGTWQRIVEGERDDGGELEDGESRVREYLTKVSNQGLVQQFGIWLANRNPKLGVQVFAEDKGRAPRFDPEQVVALLRAEAPDAVKYYLEHLVFGKGHTNYVHELIAYYLDLVIGELESTQASREAFAATYTAYRALQAPKSTYQQFLTDNAPVDNEVWQSRLRLLQLLGGTHDYDATAIRKRIVALPDDLLVPETIILDGRERRHEDAIRLLVHKLGDYDTAVSYCLRGGSSIYTTANRRQDSMPTHEMQSRLFRAVLGEFLAIEDVSDRVEQTGLLLERFGGWFELDEVLGAIPDTWSASVVSGFLLRAVRRLVQEKNESMVTRALSSAENLRVSHDVVSEMDKKGPTIEAAQ